MGQEELLIETGLTGAGDGHRQGPALEPDSVAAARIPFVDGLDGLRGLAVLAVMAFHAGLPWAGGGLLGVDVFFVLSGFLVTSLLLAEHARTGTVRLPRFWAQRARRLLPALFVLLGAVCAWAHWESSGIAPKQLRGDAVSTLAYIANWHYLASGQNYFVRFGAPSPLLHTRSLAVEEQFYWVWPLVVLLTLGRFGRRALGWVTGSLAVCSAGLGAALYLGGASPNRLYYGTDTRAQSIMIGALLALLVPPSGAPSAGHGRNGERLAALRARLDGAPTAGTGWSSGSLVSWGPGFWPCPFMPYKGTDPSCTKGGS